MFCHVGASSLIGAHAGRGTVAGASSSLGGHPRSIPTHTHYLSPSPPLFCTTCLGMNLTQAAVSEDKELSKGEKYWRDHYDWLLQCGYQLRPRYRPGWVPSWKGTNKIPLSCEDGLHLKVCLTHTLVHIVDSLQPAFDINRRRETEGWSDSSL